MIDNVFLAQRLAGRLERDAGAELLRSFGLADRMRAYPSELSGGETARAGLAVALANDPAVVLADEPTGELDAVNADRVGLPAPRTRSCGRGGPRGHAQSSSCGRGGSYDRTVRRAGRRAMTVEPGCVPLVCCAGVARTYGTGRAAVVAVHSVSCIVEGGEQIALVGPSGSGKSTLLHLMAGLDTPTTGTITWPGLGTKAELRPGPVGVIFQGPSLLEPLDVVENVALPLLLAGADPATATALARAAPRAARSGGVGRQAARGAVRRPGTTGCRRARARVGTAVDPGRRAHRPARPRHRPPGHRRAVGGRDSNRGGAGREHARSRSRGAPRPPMGDGRRDAARSRHRGGRVLGLTWIRGLAARRPAGLGATAVGVAIAVALLASIGAFLASSKATMTKRASATVGVDWQVETQTGGDSATVLSSTSSTPGVLAALPVGFAQSSGFTATTGGSTQVTGPGVVLGVPDRYRATFRRGSARPRRLTTRDPRGTADGRESARGSRRRRHDRARRAGAGRGDRRRRRRPAPGQLALPEGRRADRRATTGPTRQRAAVAVRRVASALRSPRAVTPGSRAGADPRQGVPPSPGRSRGGVHPGQRGGAQPRGTARRSRDRRRQPRCDSARRRAPTPCTRKCCSSSWVYRARCSREC